MPMKLTRVFVAIVTLVIGMSVSGCAQAVKNDNAPWRTSFELFVKAINDFPVNDIPFTKVETGHVTGQQVNGDAAIMKRFGGNVEFEGIYQGTFTENTLPAEQKREKVEISMTWPSGTDPNINWKLHLYPKAGSLGAWKALKPNTPVKFRAVVRGIAQFYPAVYGEPHLRGYSILLEDGELVSK